MDPPPAHLSTCDTKRVSKAPRVRSCSEASPRKSRSSSTSRSSTSRTSSPRYLPPISFSYLAEAGRRAVGGGRAPAPPRGHVPPPHLLQTRLLVRSANGDPGPAPPRAAWNGPALGPRGLPRATGCSRTARAELGNEGPGAGTALGRAQGMRGAGTASPP